MNTENTEKPKVDLASIIAKANKKTEDVKSSTEKIESKTKGFRVLPGYPKYEWNGTILRSVDKKHVLSFKTGTKKYQLFHKDGSRKVLGKEEISALFPAEEKTSSLKTPKEKVLKPKKERVVKAVKTSLSKEEISELKEQPKIKKILDLSGPKHIKHYSLHVLGIETEKIMALTDTPYNAVKRNIWYYTSGKKTLKE